MLYILHGTDVISMAEPLLENMVSIKLNNLIKQEFSSLLEPLSDTTVYCNELSVISKTDQCDSIPNVGLHNFFCFNFQWYHCFIGVTLYLKSY